MPDDRAWTYIGRETQAGRCHPVGTVVTAVVDDPADPKFAAKAAAKWMRQGMMIERVPVEWVRKHLLTTEPYRGEPTPPPA
jgi:hypothetical protein